MSSEKKERVARIDQVSLFFPIRQVTRFSFFLGLLLLLRRSHLSSPFSCSVCAPGMSLGREGKSTGIRQPRKLPNTATLHTNSNKRWAKSKSSTSIRLMHAKNFFKKKNKKEDWGICGERGKKGVDRRGKGGGAVRLHARL